MTRSSSNLILAACVVALAVYAMPTAAGRTIDMRSMRVGDANCTSEVNFFSCATTCTEKYKTIDVMGACWDGCSIRCEENMPCVTLDLCTSRCKDEKKDEPYVTACDDGCGYRCPSGL